jgi:hypothetical protein
MKIKNFLIICILFFNAAYCAEARAKLDASAIIIGGPTKEDNLRLNNLSDYISGATLGKPNPTEIIAIIAEINEIKKLSDEVKFQEVVRARQVDIVNLLLTVNEGKTNIKVNEFINKNSDQAKKSKEQVKEFLQDIYNNRVTIVDQLNKSLSVDENTKKLFEDRALTDLATNLNVEIEVNKAKSIAEINAQAETDGKLQSNNFKEILEVIDKLNPEKAKTLPPIEINFQNPADFVKRLPDLLASRIARLIAKNDNVAQNVAEQLKKDLKPNTLIGDFKEFLGIITPEERVVRRLQKLLLDLGTNGNDIGPNYKDLLNVNSQNARDIFNIKNMNDLGSLDFINPEKNKTLITQDEVAKRIKVAQEAAEKVASEFKSLLSNTDLRNAQISEDLIIKSVDLNFLKSLNPTQDDIKNDKFRDVLLELGSRLADVDPNLFKKVPTISTIISETKSVLTAAGKPLVSDYHDIWIVQLNQIKKEAFSDNPEVFDSFVASLPVSNDAKEAYQNKKSELPSNTAYADYLLKSIKLNEALNNKDLSYEQKLDAYAEYNSFIDNQAQIERKKIMERYDPKGKVYIDRLAADKLAFDAKIKEAQQANQASGKTGNLEPAKYKPTEAGSPIADLDIDALKQLQDKVNKEALELNTKIKAGSEVDLKDRAEFYADALAKILTASNQQDAIFDLEAVKENLTKSILQSKSNQLANNVDELHKNLVITLEKIFNPEYRTFNSFTSDFNTSINTPNHNDLMNSIGEALFGIINNAKENIQNSKIKNSIKTANIAEFAKQRNLSIAELHVDADPAYTNPKDVIENPVGGRIESGRGEGSVSQEGTAEQVQKSQTATEQRTAEEAQRKAAEQRAAEEARRVEDARRAEQAQRDRVAAEQRAAEEARRALEKKQTAEVAAGHEHGVVLK